MATEPQSGNEIRKFDTSSTPPLTPEEAKAKREGLGISKEDLLSTDTVILPEDTGYIFSLWLKQHLEPLAEIVTDDPELENIMNLTNALTTAETVQLVPLSSDSDLQDRHGWKFQVEGLRTQPPRIPHEPIALGEEDTRKFLRAVNDSIRNPLAMIAGFAELQTIRGATDEIKKQNTLIKDRAFAFGNELQKIAENDYKLTFITKPDGEILIDSHSRPLQSPTP